MKPPLLFAIILLMAADIFAQQTIKIYKKDRSGSLTILTSNIDSITILGPPCVGTPTVTYTGKVYNTVQIGQQCWLKENLDVGTQVPSWVDQTNNSIIEKYCYNDLPDACSAGGGLYQWNEAMQYATTGKAQGICPSGWHIPTNAELQTLAITVNWDGGALKTRTPISTNSSGFSALLTGYRPGSNFFYNSGKLAYFWSSSENDAPNACVLTLYYLDSSIGLNCGFDKTYGLSIRCVKD